MKIYKLNIDDFMLKETMELKALFPHRFEKASLKETSSEFSLYLGVYYLLHQAYPDLKEEDIKVNEYGKPYAEGKYFSYAHKGKMVVLATDEVDIGVDVEKITDTSYEKIENSFSLKERDFIKQDPINFFYLWTRKEALAKCVGTGLNSNIISFDVLNDTIIYEGLSFMITTEKDNNYIISACRKIL